MTPLSVDAVLFDLLTALLDSWTAWNHAAGSESAGRRWRQRYLDITYGAGAYRPYEELVRESAMAAGLPDSTAERLIAAWDTLEPWPEVATVLTSIAEHVRIGVVTNCSQALAERAVRRLPGHIDVWVAAEEAGAYKPDPRPYQLALSRLGAQPAHVLFVAGSPFDIPGAGGVGMRVAWHNRLGLPRPDGVAEPWVEMSTLRPLPTLLTRRQP